MRLKSILLQITAGFITLFHGIILGVLLSVSRQKTWSGLLIITAVSSVITLGVWLFWVKVAQKKGKSAHRATFLSLLPLIALWFEFAFLASGFSGGRIAPELAIIPASIVLICLFIFSIVLLLDFPGGAARRALLIISAIFPALIACGWVLDLAFPPKREILIHKAVKGLWEPTTAVAGIEKLSQLKVELNGWRRQAIAIPVNHGVQRVENIPPGSIFRAGIGITEGGEGYQVSVIAADETGERYKVGVWYFRRNSTRWEDVQADVSMLAGKRVKLGMQVSSWNPEGGAAQDDDSFVYISAPKIVPSPPEGARNVVVILVDTLRADQLPGYGHKHGSLPNIERLAGRSATFTSAFSVTSWTAPSVASLFTGKSPNGHGVMSFETLPLKNDVQTLSDVFGQSGWRTAAVFGNSYIGEGTGFDQGFDTFSQLPLGLIISANRQWVTKKALEGLESPAAPFFLYVHYLNPHDPYMDSEGRVPAIWKPLVFLTTNIYRNGFSGGIMKIRALKPGLMTALQKSYLGELEGVDAGIGKILNSLEAKGLMENTVVVLLSDHGEEFWEHGGLLHCRTLYNESIHIPLMIRMPGGEGAAKRIEAPVSISDIGQTALTACGSMARISDANLLGLLDTSVAPTERPICSDLINSPGSEYARIRSVIYGNKKLVFYENRSGKSRAELYFIDSDPFEQNDRAAEFPEIVGQLSPMLCEMKWLDNKEYDIQKMDPELVRKLKALGYLQ